MEDMRNAFRILIGRAGGKRQLKGRRRKCEDDIKMDVAEI
jgi:hypothetical protein